MHTCHVQRNTHIHPYPLSVLKAHQFHTGKKGSIDFSSFILASCDSQGSKVKENRKQPWKARVEMCLIVL